MGGINWNQLLKLKVLEGMVFISAICPNGDILAAGIKNSSNRFGKLHHKNIAYTQNEWTSRPSKLRCILSY